LLDSAQHARFSPLARAARSSFGISTQRGDLTVLLLSEVVSAEPGTRFARKPRMSHRTVETIIGKLATDEGFRRRFLDDPAAVLDELRGQGCELSSVEIGALTALDQAAITAFAEALDRRLQKVEFRSHPEGD
jgi:hypothetical protein